MRVSTAESRGVTTKVVTNQRLLKAAMSGLVAASGAAACGDDDGSDAAHEHEHSQNLSNEELKALCANMANEGGSAGKAGSDSKYDESDLDNVCKDKVDEAKMSVPKPDVTMYCADTVKSAVDTALKPKTPDDKITSEEQKNYKFAELTKKCDERGGYTEIHGACGGVNSCNGFSFGDWGPDAAALTEHSCTGANGCLGLSCVVGLGTESKYGDKSGKEIYEAYEFGDAEPHDCKGCHAPSTDANDHSKKDLTKFNVYVQPGSTRTEKNWLDLSAREQALKVFFGTHYTDGKGHQLTTMAAYKSVLTRKEVERVVDYIRTLTPVIQTIKVTDP